MDARLTPHHTQLLRGFTDALDNAARNIDGGVRTFGSNVQSDYQLAHPGTLTYVADAIRTALGPVDAEPEPETKPTDTDLPAGLGTDPDPYGIDLRGPHATIRSADRATLGGLADLDPRDRALYRALLHTTLDNLDRTEPTQTVIRAGNR